MNWKLVDCSNAKLYGSVKSSGWVIVVGEGVVNPRQMPHERKGLQRSLQPSASLSAGCSAAGAQHEVEQSWASEAKSIISHAGANISVAM